MKEIWKNIDGFKGKYQVSNLGNVRSFSKWKNGNLLNPAIDKGGYLAVNLVVDGRRKSRYMKIHRLVAMAFIPNPDNLPEVNHIDGNKFNNMVSNLEWVSRNENISHAYKHGLIPRRYSNNRPNARAVIQKNKSGEIIRIWDSIADIHRELGYSTNGIICCCRRKPKYHTAYGFIWEYKENEHVEDERL